MNNSKYMKSLTDILNSEILGLDVGINHPIVSCYQCKFNIFGDGHEIRSKRGDIHRKLTRIFNSNQSNKNKLNQFEKLLNKEASFLNDMNHKLSRQLVNFAAENGCNLIAMEKLDIKHDYLKPEHIHSYPFQKLQHMIEYKSAEQDIHILYVNPQHTSNICPGCWTITKSESSQFTCSKCGLTTMRDNLASFNVKLRAINHIQTLRNK